MKLQFTAHVEQVTAMGPGVPFAPRAAYTVACSGPFSLPTTNGAFYYSRRVANRIAEEMVREHVFTVSRILDDMNIRHRDWVLTGHPL